MKFGLKSEGPVPWRRVLWAGALVISFVICAVAAYRGGYVGPDYNVHVARLRDPTRFFDYAQSSPPIYHFVGYAIYWIIGPKTAFPITLGIVQAAVNTVALWWFFLYTERRFKSPVLHLALVFFVTFLPVRMIHSVTSGADWLTIPVFVLLLFVFQRFLSEETSTPKNAALLGLVLGVGIWSKYSFMAVIPAIFVIFGFLWWKRAWGLKKFVVICALSLVLPTALVFHSYWASSRAKNSVAQTVWLPKGGAPGQPDMSWRELFWVKTADLQLFKAPEYFRKEILAAHKHSYLGLVHLGTFADTMNLFQDLPGSHSIDRILIPDLKTRRPWKTPVMSASVCLGVLWTLLALVGTAWLFFGAVRRLWKDKMEREDAAVLMVIPFFLLLFLALPFVYSGALGGGWTPRYIMVPLLCFFWAGFLLLDRTVTAKWPKSAFVVLSLVVIQCGIEIVMLW